MGQYVADLCDLPLDLGMERCSGRRRGSDEDGAHWRGHLARADNKTFDRGGQRLGLLLHYEKHRVGGTEFDEHGRQPLRLLTILLPRWPLTTIGI